MPAPTSRPDRSLPPRKPRQRAGAALDRVGGVRICVFCGSSTGRGSVYVDAAKQFGRTLTERGIGLVYGGASVGTMGVISDAVIDAGGEVFGVIPRSLVDREIAHPNLTHLYIVDGMHERKARMAELADGFVALPGGAGTLEELFEVWTWAQLGLHHKPIGLLDVAGYFDALLELTAHMVAEGFLSAAYRDMLVVESEPGLLLDRLASYVAPQSKWEASTPSDRDTRH
jgi:uncharacterized protein (TIGR00730 family)